MTSTQTVALARALYAHGGTLTDFLANNEISSHDDLKAVLNGSILVRKAELEHHEARRERERLENDKV